MNYVQTAATLGAVAYMRKAPMFTSSLIVLPSVYR